MYMFLKKKKKKKNTRASAWVKTQKLWHNCPAIYLFSWEREGILVSNPIKSYKTCKCAF